MLKIAKIDFFEKNTPTCREYGTPKIRKSQKSRFWTFWDPPKSRKSTYARKMPFWEGKKHLAEHLGSSWKVAYFDPSTREILACKQASYNGITLCPQKCSLTGFWSEIDLKVPFWSTSYNRGYPLAASWKVAYFDPSTREISACQIGYPHHDSPCNVKMLPHRTLVLTSYITIQLFSKIPLPWSTACIHSSKSVTL